jgi:hypothetical protein
VPPPAAIAPTISAWSPTIPYWGDTLTITGTGFSVTPSSNWVWFRNLAGECGLNSSDTTAAVVVSASTTQLRVRIPYIESPTQVHPQNCTLSRIQLRVGTASVESADMTSRRPPWVVRWRSADGTGVGREGFRIEVDVRGLERDSTANQIAVNGVDIPAASRTQVLSRGVGLGSVSFTMPLGVSPGGQGTSWSDTARVTVRARIGSREHSEGLLVRRYPTIRIDSVRTVLVPQATPGARDSRQVTVWVRDFTGPARHVWFNALRNQSFPADIAIGERYSGPLVFSQPPGAPSGNDQVRLVATRFPSQLQSFTVVDFTTVP